MTVMQTWISIKDVQRWFRFRHWAYSGHYSVLESPVFFNFYSTQLTADSVFLQWINFHCVRILSCLHMLSCRVSFVNCCWSIFFSEFLNVDDDEMGEDNDDGMPGPENVHLLDNSGWSSRTRCVLQVVWVHMTSYWMIWKQSLVWVCMCMYLFVCVHSCRI